MPISITKPTVGASQDTWGTTINEALDEIVDAVNGANGGPDVSSVTSTANELNLLDGAVAETVVNSKAVIYGDAGEVAATTVSLGDWTITQSGSDLKFAYQGTDRFKLTSAGALTVENDITAYGSA